MDYTSYSALQQKIDDFIKSHDTNKARELLQSMSINEMPKDYVASFASLARRASLSNLALKILWREVFENNNENPDLLVELGSNLRKLDLTRQAEKWLQRVPESSRKQRELALNFMHQWKSAEARDCLLRSLELSDPKDNLELGLIRVNLAACLVALQKYDEALKYLNESLPYLRENHQLLHLNSLELMGQCYFGLEDLQEADKIFDQALGLLNSKNDVAALLIKKWKFILSVKLGKVQPGAKEILDFSAEVRNAGLWEIIRDFDFHMGKILQNENLLLKVYFGTPHSEFKRKILSTTSMAHPPSRYVWRDGRNPTPTKLVNPYEPLDDSMPFGKANHRLLLLIISDRYRPFNVYRIFDRLFADEIYNPFASEKRIHNLLAQLRKTLVASGLKLDLENSRKGYRLRPHDHVAFLIYPNMDFDSTEQLAQEVIRSHFAETTFSRPQLEDCLPLNRQQIQRLLSQLKAEGRMEMIGQGKAAKYQLKRAA